LKSVNATADSKKMISESAGNAGLSLQSWPPAVEFEDRALWNGKSNLCTACDCVVSRLDRPGPSNWVGPNFTVHNDRPAFAPVIVNDRQIGLSVRRGRKRAPDLSDGARDTQRDY
jgi:hypothetical protein